MNKEEIGTNAGMVWQALYANGAMSFDDLIETTGLNTESAYSAFGVNCSGTTEDLNSLYLNNQIYT